MKYLYIAIFFCNLNIAKECPLKVPKQLTSRVKKELKGMGYTSTKIEPCWGISKCPDGHDNFIVLFEGKRWGQKLKGYFCPPFINQSVVYDGEKL